MRVLIIGINFHPELTGIGKYTGEMAAYLAEAGHEVRVVTAPPYYPWWRVQPPYHWWQYRHEHWHGIDIWRSPLWVPKQVTGTKRLLHSASFAASSAPLILSHILWRPHVVLVVAPAISVAPLGWLAARLSGAKAWLHVQDFEIDAALRFGYIPPGTPLAFLLQSFDRFILHSFDVVSTISQRMCDLLKGKGVPTERIYFFPNWVDTELIYPIDSDENPIRREIGLDNKDIVVLYSGNMGEKQGLDIVIDAARILQPDKNIRFVLCGEGAAKESLLVRANGLSNVLFLPLQPVERLNLLLNMADIHVLPQRPDAADLVMPSKLSGMLASGKPVIATALPEEEVGQVVSQVGLLVPPGNPMALAEAIRSLARDADLRASLGQKGRRYVTAHYAREIVLANFLEHLTLLTES